MNLDGCRKCAQRLRHGNGQRDRCCTEWNEKARRERRVSRPRQEEKKMGEKDGYEEKTNKEEREWNEGTRRRWRLRPWPGRRSRAKCQCWVLVANKGLMVQVHLYRPGAWVMGGHCMQVE